MCLGEGALPSTLKVEKWNRLADKVRHNKPSRTPLNGLVANTAGSEYPLMLQQLIVH